MLQFTVWSDLHLELPGAGAIPEFEPRAPFLFLIGDIGIPSKDSLRELFEIVSARFEKVFFVAGNHEYYRGEYYETKQRLQQLCESFPNVLWMDKRSVVEGQFRIIGATLWSQVPPAAETAVLKGLTDYNAVTIKTEGAEAKRKITIADTNRWHEDELQYILSEVQLAREENQVAIVLTHHAPLLKGTSHPRYTGELLNHGFSTDLSVHMGNPIAVWCYGHTHFCSNFMANGTRILANQKGYPMNADRTFFKSDQVVTVNADCTSTVV